METQSLFQSASKFDDSLNAGVTMEIVGGDPSLNLFGILELLCS
jgi:hypothetical protein